MKKKRINSIRKRKRFKRYVYRKISDSFFIALEDYLDSITAKTLNNTYLNCSKILSEYSDRNVFSEFNDVVKISEESLKRVK